MTKSKSSLLILALLLLSQITIGQSDTKDYDFKDFDKGKAIIKKQSGTGKVVYRS